MTDAYDFDDFMRWVSKPAEEPFLELVISKQGPDEQKWASVSFLLNEPWTTINDKEIPHYVSEIHWEDPWITKIRNTQLNSFLVEMPNRCVVCGKRVPWNSQFTLFWDGDYPTIVHVCGSCHKHALSIIHLVVLYRLGGEALMIGYENLVLFGKDSKIRNQFPKLADVAKTREFIEKLLKERYDIVIDSEAPEEDKP